MTKPRAAKVYTAAVAAGLVVLPILEFGADPLGAVVRLMLGVPIATMLAVTIIVGSASRAMSIISLALALGPCVLGVTAALAPESRSVVTAAWAILAVLVVVTVALVRALPAAAPSPPPDVRYVPRWREGVVLVQAVLGFVAPWLPLQAYGNARGVALLALPLAIVAWPLLLLTAVAYWHGIRWPVGAVNTLLVLMSVRSAWASLSAPGPGAAVELAIALTCGILGTVVLVGAWLPAIPQPREPPVRTWWPDTDRRSAPPPPPPPPPPTALRPPRPRASRRPPG